MCARGKEEKQEQQQGQPAAASDNTLLSVGKNNWKCSLCDKVFDSFYILNYHNMLEHSAHKRQPIGVA